MKRFTVFILICASIFALLTACGDSALIAGNEEEINELTSVKEDGLLSDVLYVKDGTTFNPVFFPDGSDKMEATSDPKPTDRYLLLLDGAMESVPTLYKNERLAVRTMKTSDIAEIKVERFKDNGWTFGAYGFEWDETMEYYSAPTSNAIEGTSMGAFIANNVDNKSLSVASISGNKPVLSLPKTIKGVDKDNTYLLNFFVGTASADFEIAADTHLYESSEAFYIMPAERTDFGYVAFEMPDDCKPGYYLLGKYGFIRYIDDAKTDEKESYDMNLVNTFDGVTHAIDDSLTKTERTEMFKVDEDCEYLRLTLTYNRSYVSVDKATLKFGDIWTEPIDTSVSGSVQYSLKNARAGEYELYLSGYNVEDISIMHSTDGVIEEEVEEEPETEEESEEAVLPEPDTEFTPEPEAPVTEAPTPEPTAAPTEAPVQNTQPETTYEEPSVVYYEEPIYEYVEVPINDPLTGAEIGGTQPG